MADSGHTLTSPHSFDHIVGAGEQGRRKVEAEGARGRQIDDELEFGRLFDRHVAGFRASRDSVHDVRSLTKHPIEARPIRHEAARVDRFAERKH
jgi:hypothetical protein